MLREARILQNLRYHDHQNVARYLGCVEKNGRITGLAFQQYYETLNDRLRDGRHVDVGRCVEQIQAGLKHLHDLNLDHNDINGNNVMFTDRDSDAVVIIDFDSCAYRGSVLPSMHGHVAPDIYTSEFENDHYALEILRVCLVEEG